MSADLKLATLVSSRLKSSNGEKVEVSGHDLYKLGLFDQHDRANCPQCSRKTEAAVSKRFFVIKSSEGDYFIRTGVNRYSRTDDILQATKFDETIIASLADPIKRQYWMQVLGRESEIIEVRLSFVARKVADL